MTYSITNYSYQQAKKLGVHIQPSTKKNKKIDVFTKSGDYICSIGDKRYLDFPNYIRLLGKTEADKRRRLYKIRHEKDRHKIGTAFFSSRPNFMVISF